MKQSLCLTIVLLGVSLASGAEPYLEKTDLFQAETDGYKAHRRCKVQGVARGVPVGNACASGGILLVSHASHFGPFTVLLHVQRADTYT